MRIVYVIPDVIISLSTSKGLDKMRNEKIEIRCMFRGIAQMRNSESCQTSMMERFAKVIDSRKPF